MGTVNHSFSLSKHWICLCKPPCPGLATPETPQRGDRKREKEIECS